MRPVLQGRSSVVGQAPGLSRIRQALILCYNLPQSDENLHQQLKSEPITFASEVLFYSVFEDLMAGRDRGK